MAIFANLAKVLMGQNWLNLVLKLQTEGKKSKKQKLYHGLVTL